MRELAEEKGVAEAKVVETIELAVAAAYKKDYGKKGQIIRARLDPASGALRFSQVKSVVDEQMIKSEEEIIAEEAIPALAGAPRRAAWPAGQRRDVEEEGLIAPPAEGGTGGAEPLVRKVRFNPERHIMLEDARAIQADIQPGAELEFSLEVRSDFGRIASQTAKQVIIQRIREAEREATYGEYKGKEGGIVSGIVQRIEGRNIFVDLGRGVGILTADEQLPRERVTVGERLKALLLFVEKDQKGPGIFLSRSHPRFLAKLFELEVPEIASGVVEIKAVAREAGSRTKIAVASNDPAIDPVGSMVGQRGVRVSTVMNEVSGEKIDIIEWSEDPSRFIGNALSPARVLDVAIAPERREARALVPEDQLSLAIGKGGQNVRLAAKLTGWKIDVRSPAKPPAPTASPEPEGGTAAGPAPEAVAEEEAHPPDQPEEKPEPAADAPASMEQPKRKRAAKKKPASASESPGTSE